MMRFENVGLRYGKGPEVLRDLDFSLEAGSFHFLSGPSGAGKTSLLRLMLLSVRPTRGLIHIFGQETSSLTHKMLPAMRRRIGVVFQEFRLLDHLTIFENVALPLRVAGGKYDDYNDNVMELLSWVGLREYANDYPPVLSGGEKQRTAIARAVITRPEMLLADEPTGNVDPELARWLLRLFLELNRFGTTVLIATHDEALIKESGCAELIIRDGQITKQS